MLVTGDALLAACRLATYSLDSAIALPVYADDAPEQPAGALNHTRERGGWDLSFGSFNLGWETHETLLKLQFSCNLLMFSSGILWGSRPICPAARDMSQL